MIARAWDVATHVAATHGNRQFSLVRILVFIIVWSAVVVVAGCTQSEASRPKVEPKPTPAPKVSPTPGRPEQAERITPDWPNHFTFTEHSIPSLDFVEDGYELKMQYPQISFAKNEARRFNKWIKNKVLGYANEFRRLADAEQRRKNKKKPVLWGLNLSYVVYYSNENLVSLRLTHSVMGAGQMHPIAYYETINFDLKKGRQLRAKDVFKRGYLKSFSTYSRKHLLDHYANLDEDGVKRGTEPNVSSFPNWNIVPDGVLLSFEDYQVGPHSFGQPEFVVPFSAMRDTIQQNVLRTLVVSQ